LIEGWKTFAERLAVGIHGLSRCVLGRP